LYCTDENNSQPSPPRQLETLSHAVTVSTAPQVPDRADQVGRCGDRGVGARHSDRLPHLQLSLASTLLPLFAFRFSSPGHAMTAGHGNGRLAEGVDLCFPNNLSSDQQGLSFLVPFPLVLPPSVTNT
jgi:hypothetical protein